MFGSSFGTFVRAAVFIWVTMSSERILVRDPLNARPIGERTVETMTASGSTCITPAPPS